MGYGFNILVTGAKGQLGSEIRYLVMNEENNSILKTKNLKFFFTDKDELDITDKNAIEKFVKENGINVIINCAAYTAVDKAESEPESADLINHKAVKYLAEISKEYNIFLIHISTDYVFDGKNYRPYVEDDRVNPQGVYGLTKLRGEEAIKAIKPNSIIIRTSWVYSVFGHNFVKTMLRLSETKKELGVIFDQIGTPTNARDLAKAILEILNKFEKVKDFKVEIYHFSNEGICSWYDFAKAIFEIKAIDIEVRPIETKEYPTPAKRPHYSVLNKSKIKERFQIEIPYWRDSLKEMLKGIE